MSRNDPETERDSLAGAAQGRAAARCRLPFPVLALLACLPAALAYLGFLANPPIFDDQGLTLAEMASVDARAFTPRFLAWWSFQLGSLAGGDLLALGRLGNLTIHMTNALLVALVSRQLLRIARAAQPGRIDVIAALAGMLFALHPVAAFAAGYLIQRSILLSLCFALLAMFFHLRGQAAGRPAWFVAAAAMFALSVFSKEHSVALPGALALASYWLHRTGRPWHWRWAWVFVAYGAISILITALVMAGVGAGAIYEPQAMVFTDLPEHPHLTSLVAQFGFFFKYLGLWLAPLPGFQAIDMQHGLPGGPWFWWGVAGVVAFVALGAASLWQLRSGAAAGMVALAILWAQCLFVSEFWSVRLAESFVLYRSYLWFPLLPLAIAYAAYRAGQRLWRGRRMAGWLAVAGMVALSGAFAAGLLQRLRIFSSELAVWEEVVRVNAGARKQAAARGHYMLGLSYGNVGRYDEAEKEFRATLALMRHHSGALNNLGSIQYLRGEIEAARASWIDAIAADGSNPTPYYNLHLLELRNGNFALARDYQERHRAALQAHLARRAAGRS